MDSARSTFFSRLIRNGLCFVGITSLRSVTHREKFMKRDLNGLRVIFFAEKYRGRYVSWSKNLSLKLKKSRNIPCVYRLTCAHCACAYVYVENSIRSLDIETLRFSPRHDKILLSFSLHIASYGSLSNRPSLVPVDSPNGKGNRQQVQLKQFRTGCIIV